MFIILYVFLFFRDSEGIPTSFFLTPKATFLLAAYLREGRRNYENNSELFFLRKKKEA